MSALPVTFNAAAYRIFCRGARTGGFATLAPAAFKVESARSAAHGGGSDRLAGTQVVLKTGKARLFKDGNPMVYGGAVDFVLGSPKSGDAVLISDSRGNYIGWGFYNPESMFRVRVMQLKAESGPANTTDIEAAAEHTIRERIAAAVALRASLNLQQTTVYRLINSEGDGLSGLVADVFNSHLVVQSSAAWVERHRALIQACLASAAAAHSISWRPSAAMLAEEGLVAPDLPPPAEEQPEGPGSLTVTENGASFIVPGSGGQKTGFYADQRDSRMYIRHLAPGRRVLDLCCYTGGFAVNAALGGAVHVTGVDSSSAAIALAEENRILNRIRNEQCSFVAADISDFMREAREAGQAWDIVILDPPKLAPSRKSLTRATGKYQRLNAAAMRLVKPGGLLMTCSCSGAMTQSGGFLPVLKEAAVAAGRRVVTLRQAGAAPDHPLSPSYPEGQYLTNVLLCVQ